MTALDWSGYLTPNAELDEQRRAICRSSFAGQRERIRTLYQELSPETVVCMGAGYLNDIPIGDMVASGSSVYLVDWMKGVSREAYKKDVVQRVDNQFQCLICDNKKNPREYCLNFTHRDRLREKHHCARFRFSGGNLPLCESFQWSLYPHFLDSDITQGRAQDFARRAMKTLANAKTPREAFKKASLEVRDSAKAEEILPIQDHSVDLITSSMVASQFDHEPYGFLSALLERKFGEKTILENARVLEPLMEKLRDRLFEIQVDGHCREMRRLLKPGGRVYFSAETFHRPDGDESWFSVALSRKALETVEKYFSFDFDRLPGGNLTDRVKIPGGESIVGCYVLTPRSF